MWQRLTLRRRARRAFERARGTSHVEMLRRTQDRLDAEWHARHAELVEARRACQRVQSERDEILIVLLSRHLVHTRLDEVSGIDGAAKARMIRDVFDGHLEDLRSAQWVIGLGDERQRAINDWVLDNRRRFPELLARDFPGRREVVARFRPRLEVLETHVRSLQAQVDEVVGLRECVGEALARLWRVTADDFIAALRDPSDSRARAAVAAYERGVFAEWEPPPEWYRRACMQPECADGLRPVR